MAKYTTRVELHGAVAKDYEKLHDEMEAEGFTRTWETAAGVVYHLPTAEYDFRGDEKILGVRTLAIKAAKRVNSRVPTSGAVFRLCS